ncbi:peptidylprolyl isomerase [Taibaiella lutea]|uniref:Peptidyl-prolyl cis-trans isomerase n=1 Tax=Taibaiella lutea TaxID=2608001 RepID=A0A5M6CK77_9BACT|nr:peptidylprolyl isomerase [Taibaiella lutea]KAA5533529.1 peptidylprolyl isomerase [Taibaiella lutea]
MKKITLLALFLLSVSLSFAQKYRATITTAYGKIELFLYDNTPKHRDNFVKLAKEHFFDSTLFHRVIPEFMIQGGDPESKHAPAGTPLGNGDVGYRVPAEINNIDFHKRGVLAAARDNNPDKSSSGCQFYITVGKKYTDAELDNISKRTGRIFTKEQREVYKTTGGTPHLDGNYTVYGEVTKGMDIVDKIVTQPRAAGDRPNTDQRILKIRVKKKFLFFWI